MQFFGPAMDGRPQVRRILERDRRDALAGEFVKACDRPVYSLGVDRIYAFTSARLVTALREALRRTGLPGRRLEPDARRPREEAARAIDLRAEGPPYSAASRRGRSTWLRSALTSSAVRNATSRACSALRRGSQ